ncbi:MAG: MoaD/ThiS family protein [Chloroflexota bacterium]
MSENVLLKVYAPLGEVAGKALFLPLAGPESVGEFLVRETRRLGCYEWFFDKEGAIRRSFTVLLNGTSIYHAAGLESIIRPGDEIAILAFMAGGAPSLAR